MNLLKRLFPRPAQPIQHRIVPVNPMTLSLDGWRASNSLVDQSRKQSDSELFKAQVQVLNNESPAKRPMPGGTSATDRLVQQGRVEGYYECLRNLQLFSKYKKLPQTLEATFEPPEEKAA